MRRPWSRPPGRASSPSSTTWKRRAPWPFAPDSLAGIVVTNYLHRPLFGQIAAALAPDGVLIYETFARGNEIFGKPSNPDFLLNPGELLDLAARGGLQVLAYEDGLIDLPKSGARAAPVRGGTGLRSGCGEAGSSEFVTEL
jgi:SAM-dependent methyltransferase